LVNDAMTVAIKNVECSHCSNVVFLLGGIKRQATSRPHGGAIKQLKRFPLTG
jgi:ribosomal protein S27AE